MSAPEVMLSHDAVQLESAAMDNERPTKKQKIDTEQEEPVVTLASLCPDLKLETLKKLLSCTTNVEEAAQIALSGQQVAEAFINTSLQKEVRRQELAPRGVDVDELAANSKEARVPFECVLEMAMGQIGAFAAALQFPHLYQNLTAAACAVLVAAEGDRKRGYRAAAILALRHKVWQCRNKERLYHKKYTRERSEAALQRWVLTPSHAKKCGLPEEEGHTWLDVVNHHRGIAQKEAEVVGQLAPTPEALWRRLSPLLPGYQKPRCHHCGSQSGKTTVVAPETDDERNPEFNLQGRVNVLKCSACGKQSRWWRSQAPEIMLNPSGNWGRLCGEVSDLKVWFAGYLGMGQRYVISVDNDHIWTETWNSEKQEFPIGWMHRNGWTDIVAIGSSLPGTGPSCDMASEQVTERYLEGWSAGPTRDHVRGLVLDRRMDATGKKTNLGTVIGYACAQGGLDAFGMTAVLRSAQHDYDSGVELSDLSRNSDDLMTTDIEDKVQQLVEAFGVEEMAARGALESAAGNIDRAADLLLS
jgi:hypothetical protein